MLLGLFVLLCCQLAGDILARAFSLPIPGPVIGIVLLVMLLYIRQGTGRAKKPDEDAPIEQASDNLLRWLGLFFVPAGVGISQHFELVAANGPTLALALIGSSAATLIVTVWTFVLARRITEERCDG
ncbi:CidA/LrgA family protein [Pelagibacterium sp.]|uniref:CidA/LrgA family protein n=1 Tax=Pelagibacterium sp. TaxID=1967288 RepID=UPI003A920B55